MEVSEGTWFIKQLLIGQLSACLAGSVGPWWLNTCSLVVPETSALLPCISSFCLSLMPFSYLLFCHSPFALFPPSHFPFTSLSTPPVISQSVIVKSVERNAVNMYEARKFLLGLESNGVSSSSPSVVLNPSTNGPSPSLICPVGLDILASAGLGLSNLGNDAV